MYMTCAPDDRKYLTSTITRAMEKKKKKVEKEQQKKDRNDEFPSEAFTIDLFLWGGGLRLISESMSVLLLHKLIAVLTL